MSVCVCTRMCPCRRACERHTLTPTDWGSEWTGTTETTESIDTTDTTPDGEFSRPHVPALPDELLYMIVDHLHDDTASLQRCALASRRLLHPARVHLFASLHLETNTLVARNDNENENKRTENARTETDRTENECTENARTDNSRKTKRKQKRRCERKVNFAQFARHLSLRSAPPMSMARYIRDIDLMIDFKALMKPGSLAFIPDGFPALRSLSLHDISSKRRHNLAPRVRPGTQPPTSTSTSLRPLPSLCIYPGFKCGVPAILHILSCFASVQELHMELWCLRAEQYKTVPSLPSGFGVESLIIGGSDLMEDVPAVYDLCRAICATRTAQSLRCLRVEVRNDMYCELIREVFVANCTSLKEIALDLTRNADDMLGNRRIGVFPPLSDIPVTSALLVDKPLWGTEYEWNLDPVLDFLLVSPPTLSHLHIQTHSPDTDTLIADYVEAINWSALRERLRALKNLRRVVIEPKFGGWGWVGGRGFFSDLREIVERELAASVASGTIEVLDGVE